MRIFLAVVLLGVVASPPAKGQLLDFGGFGTPAEKVTVEAQFTPAQADRPALIFVTAKIANGYHIAALDQKTDATGGGPQPTAIALSANPNVRLLGAFRAAKPPKTRVDQQVWKGLELREHEGKATWFAPIEIAAGADPKSLRIAGKFDALACDDHGCIPIVQEFTARQGSGVPLPADIDFSQLAAEAPPAPAQASSKAAAPAEPLVGSNPLEARARYDIGKIRLRDQQEGSLVYYLLTAFVGGLILNVMPCVLPVIGLKLMSFMQQAGESRRRALVLNLWYSAGILAVFLALAAMAVTLQLGWGDQFSDSRFLIALTAVVFAMALSLLGLWEIPIPGFVNAGAVMDAAHREGAPAAFLKGILTTVLATPCTGPYMVAGLAWAVKQPPHVAMSVFTAVGLGMASPYLLVGAFPSLVRFLPRPGMWMETFKKAMGLVLLATVVWLLSSLDPPLVVPTFTLMVGITAACWWVARLPLTEPRGDRIRAWFEGVGFTAVVAVVAFGVLYPQVMLKRYERRLNEFADQRVAESQMQLAQRLAGVTSDGELQQVLDELAANVATDGDEPWQSFSLPKLARMTLDERRTVLVDFTADWCASCKFFEQTVLKTAEVQQALAEADVATMTADYTKKPAWMSETIKALGGIGVPVVAIFPASDPYRPIVFNGAYTKAGLLDAVAKASGRDVTQVALKSKSGSTMAAKR